MPQRKRSETVAFKLRMKEPLRKRIERSAKGSGLSMNEDIVRRLEQSFNAEDARHNDFGGKRSFAVFKHMSATIELEAEVSGRSMFDDPAIIVKVAQEEADRLANHKKERK